MILKNIDIVGNVCLNVAQQMTVAARTAPKACGDDSIEVVILTGEEKKTLSLEMIKIADETGQEFFRRDAGNVDRSNCIVLIGIKDVYLGLEHCGLCGFENCGACSKSGGVCALKLTDFGIAIGSAVSIASNNRVDNRVMYSAGKAALRLSFFDSKITNCHGIPLSAYGKSPYQDRVEQTGVFVTAKE